MLYGTGALMYGQNRILLASNSIIPGSLIYKRNGSKARARRTGDILIAPVPIARDILVDDYWIRVRGAEVCLVGPIKWVAWGGRWHDMGKASCLVAIVYWNRCYHWSMRRYHGQWMISFIGQTDGVGMVNSLVVVPKSWTYD